MTLTLTSILRDHRILLGLSFGVFGWLFERYLTLSNEVSSLRSQLAASVATKSPTIPSEDAESGILISYFLPFSFLAITAYFLYMLIKDVKEVRQKGEKKISVNDILSYRIDYWLSYSTWSKPILLVAIIFTLVTFGGLLFAVITGNHLSASMWQVWLLIVDTGAHGDFDSVQSRVIGLLMTCCGMCVFGFLIGIVTDVIADNVEQLKKGRSRVIESNHSLILNWSDKTLPVISEICNANASMGGGIIVILSEEPKEDLERRIDASEIELRGSKIIVRSGSPVLTADLRKVSAERARSIVILSSDKGTPDEDDANTLRIVLSLQGLGKLQGHVVAEIKDVDNREIIHICGKEEVEVIVAHDIIGRIMILAAMQPGLALVLDRLLGFEGSEFYMQEWPELVGMTFGDAFFLFPEAVVVGLCKAQDLLPASSEFENDNNEGEASPSAIESLASRLALLERKSVVKHWLNPDPDTVIEEGDHLIVLSEDDDTYYPIPTGRSQGKRLIARARKFKSNTTHKSLTKSPTNLLFNGWRRDVGDMILELDGYVTANSQLTLLSEVPVEQRIRALEHGGLDVSLLKNITIHHSVGSPLSRRHLNTLDMTSFDSVLILADETYESDIEKMDSRSLTSLLLIRDINSKHERKLLSKHVDNMTENDLKPDANLPKSPSIHDDSEIDMSIFTGVSTKRKDTLTLKLQAISRSSSLSNLLSPVNNNRRSSTSIMDDIVIDKLENISLNVYNEDNSHSHNLPPNIIETSQQGLTIISEILDSRTKSLISRGGSSDYVASNELVAKFISLVAEEKRVGIILHELLSAEGSEIYVRPASLYVHHNEILSFWDISARAMLRKEICFGYVKNMNGHKKRLTEALRKKGRMEALAELSESEDDDNVIVREKDDDVMDTYDEETVSNVEDHIVLNPQNKDKLMMWSQQDFFIVLAEN